MTPAEQKAELLVSKYCHISRGDDTISPKQSAKQCALIYVQGIQNELNMEWNKMPGYKARWQYWEEIKTAIEQMP